MPNLNCAICKRPKDAASMKVYSTTVEERRAMEKMGEKSPKASYAYCKSCLSILSNPATGLSLMKGLIQVQARAQGVKEDVAEKAAEKFVKQVASKGTRQ